MENIIKVNVYKKYNPQKPDEGVIKQIDASYVSDGKGGYLKDKSGKPYLAPVGYNPEKSWNDALSNPLSLLDYRTGGSKDLQRSFNDTPFGGFVPAFTPIASFDVGVACSAVKDISLGICIAGGGAVNLKNRISNPNINISGDYGNNPKNVPNIEKGYEWGEENFSHIPSFVEDLMERNSRDLYNLLEKLGIPNRWKSENITDPLNQNTQFAEIGNQQKTQDFISQGFAALLSDNPQQGINQMLNSDYAKAFDAQAQQVLAQDEAAMRQEATHNQELNKPKMVRG